MDYRITGRRTTDYKTTGQERGVHAASPPGRESALCCSRASRSSVRGVNSAPSADVALRRCCYLDPLGLVRRKMQALMEVVGDAPPEERRAF